jgi:F-type H+-transporting ATPase subunit epsilon
MNLKILLPFKIFAMKSDVSDIVAETKQGSFGLLPHRRDCVATIAPGILRYKQSSGSGFVYVALDEGVLVKTGFNVQISVRNAVGGATLNELRKAVDEDFLVFSEQEKKALQAVRKIESRFVSQLARLHHE